MEERRAIREQWGQPRAILRASLRLRASARWPGSAPFRRWRRVSQRRVLPPTCFSSDDPGGVWRVCFPLPRPPPSSRPWARLPSARPWLERRLPSALPLCFSSGGPGDVWRVCFPLFRPCRLWVPFRRRRPQRRIRPTCFWVDGRGRGVSVRISELLFPFAYRLPIRLVGQESDKSGLVFRHL